MKKSINKISLFSLMLVCSINIPVDAAIHNKNTRSYAEAYSQVNAVRQQAEYMQSITDSSGNLTDTSGLPIAVDNTALATAIINNAAEGVTFSDLENCSMIYPNGSFRWGIPASGVRRTQQDQCIGVVELRNATSGTLLATTTLAAGDTMKCNIDSFPSEGWNQSLKTIQVPNDKEPTIEEVEQILNEEQKQNAGIKIAAGALVAGLAGNMLSPKVAGDKNTLPVGFGSKEQVIGTAIGAASGAGIIAASTYSGKVAGDTIKSTAVNAASGMVIGNMLAGANGEKGSLIFKKCILPDETTDPDQKSSSKFEREVDCLVGDVYTTTDKTFHDRYCEVHDEYFKKADSNNNACDFSNDQKNVIFLVNKSGQMIHCRLMYNPLPTEGKYEWNTLKEYGDCRTEHKLMYPKTASPEFNNLLAEYLGKDSRAKTTIRNIYYNIEVNKILEKRRDDLSSLQDNLDFWCDRINAINDWSEDPTTMDCEKDFGLKDGCAAEDKKLIFNNLKNQKNELKEICKEYHDTDKKNRSFHSLKWDESDQKDLLIYLKVNDKQTYMTKEDGDSFGRGFVSENDEYLKVIDGTVTDGKAQHAYAIFNSKPHYGKLFKNTTIDEAWKEIEGSVVEYRVRKTDGNVGKRIEGKKDKDGNVSKITFKPTNSAEIGESQLVDITDRQRSGGTIVGATTGGVMGGWAGYQGAKTELENRWVEAVREYQDSLNTVVCVIGGSQRFLAKYNDYIEIPALPKSDNK